jgi:hypothetical protein
LEVVGQLYSPAALPQEKEPPTEQGSFLNSRYSKCLNFFPCGLYLLSLYILPLVGYSLLYFHQFLLQQDTKHFLIFIKKSRASKYACSFNTDGPRNQRKINLIHFTMAQNDVGGMRWRSWLRHYATRRKIAGSIPDEAL